MRGRFLVCWLNPSNVSEPAVWAPQSAFLPPTPGPVVVVVENNVLASLHLSSLLLAQPLPSLSLAFQT